MNRSDAAFEWVESRALTGLRGIAAILVMLHHFYLRLAIDQHLPFLQWLLRKGYLGVDLFFVLSGFVMAMVYGAWFDGSRPRSLVNYVRFMVRRVARLWPLHAAVLLALILLGVEATRVDLSPRLVVANFAMIQAWAMSAEINPPAWSISTEFLAYLLFPALAPLALRGRVGPVVLLGLVVAAIGACIAFAPPLGPMRRGWMDIYYNYSALPALRCLAGVMIGLLAWRAGRVRAVQAIAGLRWTGPLALACFIGMLLGRVNDLLILPILPVIVLGMHYGRGPVHRALSANPLHGLGLLSYAIYLVHVAMLSQFPFAAGPLPAMLALYLAATVAVAMAAHRLVELPGRRAIRAAGDAALVAWARRTNPPLQDRPR